jgi:hypothetical protein
MFYRGFGSGSGKLRKPLGRLGNLGGDCDVSIKLLIGRRTLTLGGQMSLYIVHEPRGIWLGEDCKTVSKLIPFFLRTYSGK